jgi:hypothetical protein
LVTQHTGKVSIHYLKKCSYFCRLMKKIALVLLLFYVLTHHVGAQTGQEWIDFGSTYFKVQVAKDGIYRINYSDLQSAGIPVGSIDPKTLRLFHRGVEQAIHVDGESDSQLDPADYIEFYGKRNDGTLDASLYRPSTLQPHSYYNLYNDTTAYFLTFDGAQGKRMAEVSEPNSSNLPSDAYHLNQKLLILKDQYAFGLESGDIQNAFFDQGEGWTGAQVVTNQSLDYTLDGFLQSSPTSGDPTLEMLLVGRWTVAHTVEIYVGPATSSLRLLTTASFDGFATQLITQPLSWSDIGGDGKLVVRIRATAPLSRISASYVKVLQQQRLDNAGASEKVFRLNDNSPSYLEIENPSSGMRLFDVTDPSNVVRIGTTMTATLNAMVPATSAPPILFASNNTITPVIKKARFRPITPAQHDFVIISHKRLMKPALSYANPVKAYAEYRASQAGGEYDTLVVDMGLLYDQYSYGETTPVAIYNFMKFMTTFGSPKYLFLIGKGLSLNYGYYRNPVPFVDYQDLVPAAGFPTADILYTAGLEGSTYEPGVPTGRISATSPLEVAAYLDKVKEAAALPFDDLWRKNLLHLSGGIEEGEPEKFRQYLVDYEDVAESYYLGGNVSARAKRSRAIEQNIDVSTEVNKGVSLITFFGHSSPTTLDFDVGFVTNDVLGYNNKGKYPMFLINGCNAGSFFLYGTLFGEDWINAADRGALGFIAHAWYGLESTLRNYSDRFYQVGYGDSLFIGKGIGDIQKETARRFMQSSSQTMANITQAQQMVLLGDPAVKLFGATKPDYETNTNNLSIQSFNDEPVSALSDSLALRIIVRNFGVAFRDTFRIEVKREFNDNSFEVYDSLFAPVLYSDTLYFVIRKGREAGGGNNTFTVTLDPDGIVDELNENNNTATLGLFVPLNGTKNLFPSKFAIVNESQTNLAFQSTDLLSDERDFIIEFDTLNTFDSPYKKHFTVSGKVLASQMVTLLDQDSLTYYWRTKLAEVLPGESDAWEMSSFTFIDNGPEGWAQVHFPQYLENEAVGLVKDPQLRRLGFTETVSDVSIRTFGSAHSTVITDHQVKINGAEYNLTTQGFVCRYNTINLIAFDRRSTTPYIGIPFKWYTSRGRACGREPWTINSFVHNELVTGNNDDIVAYVNNIVPGDSVVLYSVGNAFYSLWPAAAKVKLGELGISVAQLDALVDGEPVVIFGRKGLAPGSATVYRTSSSPPTQQELFVEETITGRYSSGEMTSPLIGPAAEWHQLVSRKSAHVGADQSGIDVIGVKLNGEEELLFPNISLDLGLAGVDAGEYPWLRLRYKTQDDVDLTAVQLKKWLVLFEPVAEGLLLYKGSREPQAVLEGEQWTAAYGFVNISGKTFSDSLSVKFETFNTTLLSSDPKSFRIKAPAPGDTTSFSVAVSTTSKGGLNDVNIFVNPRILPEQYYDNNVLELRDYLNVVLDDLNPILDVTIDGRHVVNGDYVSPNPVVNVLVWDESENLLKTDTVGVNVFLAYPCEGDCELVRINFSSPDVEWFPATDTSEFRVIFRPKNLQPGQYTLQVSATDGNGNPSGSAAYRINFIVSDENSIVISDPYPNPTSLQSTVRITIGGVELPSDLSMRFYSATGSFIKSLGVESFAPFIIGENHITFEARDSSGDLLPQGVYIFDLRVTIGGEEVRKSGKIVIVR